MNNQSFFAVVVAVILSGVASTAAAEDKSGYWVNSEGTVWRSGHDLCWRAGYWTPALAIAECDPDLAAKPVAAEAPMREPMPESTPGPEPVAEAPVPVMPEPVGPQEPAFEKFTFSAETLFAFDKAVIRPDAADVLAGVVEKMNKYLEVELILVTGHTDRIGAEAYNQSLSERRAALVRDYLVGKGVESSRIQAAGRGETEPVIACDNIKGKESRANKPLIRCLQPNRRVVIEIAVQRESGAY
jgi:OOP family OmpA-OmpF porin